MKQKYEFDTSDVLRKQDIQSTPARTTLEI